MYYLNFLEKAPEFSKPLDDQSVKEKDSVTLTCELTKPDVPVKWLKNGKEIKPDDRVKFSVDKNQHQLVVADVSLSDADKYTCVCGDVSTDCTIKVEGRSFMKEHSLSSNILSKLSFVKQASSYNLTSLNLYPGFKRCR